MARANCTISYPNGGARAGVVGDLPIEEAALAVAEGRVTFHAPLSTTAHDVQMLLDGLGVDSLSELHRLVEIARVTEHAHTLFFERDKP